MYGDLNRCLRHGSRGGQAPRRRRGPDSSKEIVLQDEHRFRCRGGKARIVVDELRRIQRQLVIASVLREQGIEIP